MRNDVYRHNRERRILSVFYVNEYMLHISTIEREINAIIYQWKIFLNTFVSIAQFRIHELPIRPTNLFVSEETLVYRKKIARPKIGLSLEEKQETLGKRRRKTRSRLINPLQRKCVDIFCETLSSLRHCDKNTAN